jgi:hypothetical protein
MALTTAPPRFREAPDPQKPISVTSQDTERDLLPVANDWLVILGRNDSTMPAQTSMIATP